MGGGGEGSGFVSVLLCFDLFCSERIRRGTHLSSVDTDDRSGIIIRNRQQRTTAEQRLCFILSIHGRMIKRREISSKHDGGTRCALFVAC